MNKEDAENLLKAIELKDKTIEYAIRKDKEQIQEIKELKEELDQYKKLGIKQFNRPYAKRYLEERRKEIPNLLYPDSEEIYMDYYELKNRIDAINKILDNQIDYKEDRDVIVAIEEVIKSERN